MTAITDTSFSRVWKESIIRQPWAVWALTWQDIAYDASTTLNEKIDTIVSGGGGNVSIQFDDEGVALGTSGTVNEVDFVGAWVTATRGANKITVTIPWGGGGVTDHWALTGLADDDHTQYTKADGTRAFTWKQSYSSHPTFSADTEIVDKKYVDDAVVAGGGYTDEQAQDAVGGILVDSGRIDFTYSDATPSITADIIDNSVTFAKMQTIATWHFVARDTAWSGNIESISTAQAKSLLWLSGTNSGDQTSIVGITGTKAQFDTACTDGNFVYSGDNATSLNMSTARILWRSTASSWAVEEITIGSGLSLSAGVLSASGWAGWLTRDVWYSLTGTYASTTTFTTTEASGAEATRLAGIAERALFTCTNAAGSTRRIGYIKSASAASTTVTYTVVTDSDLASGDISFRITPNRAVEDYKHLISIPGELITDASNPQGLWLLNVKRDAYLLPVCTAVWTAAAGAGAACAYNVYKGATNLFTAAPDMTTSATLNDQRPNTNTISSGDNVSLRITSSAGATNKASDFQAELYLVPQKLYTSQ